MKALLDDYITVKEAAEILDEKPGDVYNRIHFPSRRRPALRTQKIGVAVMVLREDVLSAKARKEQGRREVAA
jgi:hypothetical protein